MREETEIKLKQIITIISPYKGKSKFDLFKNLQIGDIIEVTSPFRYANGNRGHTYAQSVTLTNTRTLDTFTDSLNSILNRLDKCEYKELS